MKIKIRELKLENLTKFVFRAPPWWLSIIYIAVIGGIFELIAALSQALPQFIGVAIAAPQILAVLLVPILAIKPFNPFTLNRSGLLSLAVTLFTLPILLLALIPGFNIIFAYIIAAGFTLAIRMVVMTACVDFRMPRILLASGFPALLQIVALLFLGDTDLLIPMLVSLVMFGAGTALFLAIFDKPLKRGFGLGGMEFTNVYLANLTSGSNSMESYLSRISELATVPETTFFFRRDGKKDFWFVVPNLHPGPMSNIGGSNFPNILFNHFRDEATVLVSHGCASHDLNLISNNETQKIADAIRESKAAAEAAGSFYHQQASAPVRSRCGSVSILSQKFGDSLLMVTTRTPEMTEDMDYSIGRIVMGEAKLRYAQVGFVDAHNCMLKETKVIYPSTSMGNEFITGAEDALSAMEHAEQFPLEIGVSHTELPFEPSRGFGNTGMITLVVKTGEAKTAYVLFDGNNVKGGVRDILRDAVLARGYADCEIMTTDSHIVNMFSGHNPVGEAVPAEEILPFVLQGIDAAESDISPAEVGAASGECRDVRVFGPGKLNQLVTAVSGITNMLIPFFVLCVLCSGLMTAVVWAFL